MDRVLHHLLEVLEILPPVVAAVAVVFLVAQVLLFSNGHKINKQLWQL
jgi:hypothetical protein